jgi:hypothetical protein
VYRRQDRRDPEPDNRGWLSPKPTMAGKRQVEAFFPHQGIQCLDVHGLKLQDEAHFLEHEL